MDPHTHQGFQPQINPGVHARDVDWVGITDAINAGIETPEQRKRRRHAELVFSAHYYQLDRLPEQP